MLSGALWTSPRAHGAVPAPAQAQAALELCETKFAATPNAYDAARCFYEASQHEQNSNVRARVEKLSRQHPDNGNLVIVLGHFDWSDSPDRALEKYSTAAGIFARRGDITGELLARSNRRGLFVERGDWQRADAEVTQIEALGRRAKTSHDRDFADIEIARHALRSMKGVAGAYERLQGVQSRSEAGLSYALHRQLLVGLADAATYLGRLDEARQYYSNLGKLARDRNDPFTIALATGNLANTDILRLEAMPSDQLRARTISEFEDTVGQARALGRPAMEARALASLARLFVRRRPTHAYARAHIRRCLGLTQAPGLQEFAAMCHAVASQLQAETNPEAARESAARAMDVLASSGEPWRRVYAWRQVMRRAWESQRPELALDIGWYALGAIESIRKTQRAHVGRREVLAQWTLDYDWLAARAFEASQEDRAFLERALAIVERGRARVLLERVADPRTPVDHAPTDANDTPASSLDSPADGSWPALLDNLKSRIEHANVAEASRPTTAIADIQGRLADDEALVHYTVGLATGVDGAPISGAWALVITSSSAFALELAGDRSSAAEEFRAYRGLIERRDGSERAPSSALYARWLAPIVERIPETVHELAVVPDGALHDAPLAHIAAVGSDRRLRISMAASAQLWSHWRDRSTRSSSERALALVDPELPSSKPGSVPQTPVLRSSRAQTSDPAWAALPATRLEGAAIKAELGSNSVVLAGDEATETQIATRWTPEFGLLHLGAHAVLDPFDADNSAIILAPSPGNDGRLTVRDIEAMQLPEALVILSGCATAGGQLWAGEGVVSLARAFQSAGATTVIASLWPVRDGEAAQLFERFYEELGTGGSVVAALEQAQFELRQAGVAAQGHAGFIVMGDGRARLVPVSPWSALGPVRWLALMGLLALAGIIYSGRKPTAFTQSWRKIVEGSRTR